MTPSLFDGIELRDVSMKEAKKNADPKWRMSFDAALAMVVAANDTFTTDDVWDYLDKWGAKTHERRAIGPMMTDASRRGMIRATHEYRPSTRPECHARPIRVWEVNR